MKNDMQATSIEAYRNPQNKEKRTSHKERIRNFFEEKKGAYTIRQVSTAIGLPYAACQKRITDLRQEGFLEIAGKAQEGGNSCHVFRMCRGQKSIFSTRPKTRYEVLKESLWQEVSEATYEQVTRRANEIWKSR